MIKRLPFINGRIGVIISPTGIDQIVFSSRDRKKDLGFYLLIERELRKFENSIALLASKRQEKENNADEQ